MKRLLTKESRDAVRTAIRNNRIEKGWSREEYKGLEIFTTEDQNFQGKTIYSLEVYKDNAAAPILNYIYYSEDQRSKRIQDAKDNYDRSIEWKKEQKEKNKGRSSSHAAASAAIKAELMENFPGVKFSVRSDSYSMGDSVHISWTDGPTTDQVDSFAKKYQYGSFNGMEDIYEMTNSRDDIPQTKYVSSSRTQSDQVKQRIDELYKEHFANADSEDWKDKMEADRMKYQIFSKSTLPPGCEILGLERAGNFGDHYLTVNKGWGKNTGNAAASKAEQREQVSAPQLEPGKIAVIDYSEKAIAVIGETREIKDQLKALGGKFNFRLTCGAGWIFPKSKQAEVIEKLKEIKQRQEETMGGLKDEFNKMQKFIEETDAKLSQPTPDLFATVCNPSPFQIIRANV